MATLALPQSTTFAQATTTGTPGGGTTTGTTPPGAPGAAPAAKALGAPEKKFIKDAGESLYYELQLSDSAKTKAGTEPVKRLGESLNKELNKIWEPLAAFAQANNEPLATALAGGDKSAYERLGKADAKRYDQQFLGLIEKEAKKLARTLEAAAKSPNADIKKIGDDWAPTANRHLTEIDNAQKEASKVKN